MQRAQQDYAQPRSVWQTPAAYKAHLEQCDRSTLDEDGFQVIERFAEKEGAIDFILFRR